MPDLPSLLERGYLPKELPSPFNSQSYAASLLASPAPPPFTSARPAWASLCRHTLARPGMLSRTLSIPNPIRFYQLASEIADSWAAIEASLAGSRLSLTRPVDDVTGERAVVPAASFERTAERSELRAAFPYLLRADIAQCYPSIYTHSLGWALHTKAKAKRRRGDSRLLGNRLDKYVQAAQDGQTMGLPIGPDTSLVLAELVLSACESALPADTHGFRYYDDFELYFSSLSEAERGRSTLQDVLNSYHLSLNSHKTEIVSLPQELQDEWVTQLRRTRLRTKGFAERSDITVLFDDTFRLAQRYPDRHVVSYALGLFETRISNQEPLVAAENWPYLQRLVLQSILAQPTAIQKAVGILDWARSAGLKLDLDIIKYSLNRYIARHVPLRHSSEVAWAIWAAVALGFRIYAEPARLISTMADDVIAILALHAREKGRLAAGIDTRLWKGWLGPGGLDGEHWLASYETQVRGWLTVAGDPIALHAGFDYLRSKDVTFYDTNASASRKQRPTPAPFRWRPIGYA